MTLQYGSTLRNDQVSQIQTAVGGSGTLLFYTGTEPANCAASATGSLLATITLPSTFLTSSAGVTTLSGTWSTTATGTGTAGYFRIVASAVCHVQGDVTSDLVLNSTSVTSGQTISVTTFGVTAGNS
jgi:hypothetical protein